MLARITLASAAVVLVLATPASAATILGQTYAAADACGANTANVQLSAAAPGYRVDAPGVITELRTEGQTAPGMRLHVFRPRGGSSYTILASVPIQPAPGVIRAPVRVPVQPGDLLGNSSKDDPNVRCGVAAGGSSDVVAFRNAVTPDSGETTIDGGQGGRLNIAATLEPDGDGDGFGDETQDRCPADRVRTTEECTADVSLTQTPVENEMERDDVNVLVITVRNNGSSPARDVRVVESFPAGVQLLAATPTSGGCAGGPILDCTLPTVAAGSAGSVFAVVRAVSLGRKEMTATATSPTLDPIQANNSVQTAFDVNARRSVVEPGAFCRVPRLLGLTRLAARRALEAAGCRLGATYRRRFRGGRFSRVRLQSIPAGVRVATRTRVSITLRRR